jgi:hypothetical protein
MSPSASTHRVLVLRIGAPGESFRRLDLLSAFAGALLCLQRIPRSGAPKDSPDLFDSAEAAVDRPRTGTGPAFLREYRLLRRRAAIGGSYRALRDASAWCAFIAANAPHLAEPGAVLALAERTLDAFEERPAASGLVLLKGLYLLARDEGYPARESWWAGLPPDLRDPVRDILNAPLPEAPDPASSAAAEKAVESFRAWLAGETDLVVPDPA